MNSKSGIYLIKNMVNGKGYVGSSMNLKERKYQHFYTLKSLRHRNPYLQASFNKHGNSNFVFYILAYVPEDKLIERETFYISYLKTNQGDKGYNLAVPDCHMISEEHKRKISETLKKKYLLHPKPPMSNEQKIKLSEALKGRNLPPKTKEQKIKMSEALRGKKRLPFSDEWKEKISKSLSGRKRPSFSEEWKENMSKALRGRKRLPFSDEWKRKMSESHRRHFSPKA